MKKLILIFLLFIATYHLSPTTYYLFAQQGDDLELTLDINSQTSPLPRIFRPTIDLSGCGLHRDNAWPQSLSTKEVLDIWQKDIGFGNLYRLQFNLWEISQLAKDKDAQNKLLNNYEEIIKKVTDAGGTVILDIFGTPAGLGRAQDKKIPPLNLRAFKEQIKETIRDLSCKKRYNIWYEVWNAPDLDSFFLGRKQEYLNLYRVVAEAIKELRLETKIHIPLGGPSVSWWFQNFDGNTILTPEKSLIYELIKFCYRYRLPLDFIAWHGYSTSPNAEKENTKYKKGAVNLIRDWLSYFNFPRDTILIVDEWNFDRDANNLEERKEKSYVTASYIPARLRNMFELGLDYQIYFALEDFENVKEGVVRNIGIFSFKSEPKAIYNMFRMLDRLGNEIFPVKLDDEFVGVIATKSEDYIAILIYNYIDPQAVINYLSKDIAILNNAERRTLLNIIKSEKLEKIIIEEATITKLRGASSRVKALLKKARELNNKAKKFSLESASRSININLKSLLGSYTYERYTLDSSCNLNCAFSALEQKEISAGEELYQEALSLKPYSVNLIILKNKPKETKSILSRQY